MPFYAGQNLNPANGGTADSVLRIPSHEGKTEKMKLYKPTYKLKSKDGKGAKVKECKDWHVTFVDNRRIRRRLGLFTNERASREAADKIQDILDSTGHVTPALQKWVESLPEKIRAKLKDFGLLVNVRLSSHISKSLTEHLSDFVDGMKADNRKETYINQTENAINRILTGCGFSVWNDIDGNSVKTFLAKDRSKDGYGERTYNCYLRAFKEFCKWMIQEGRAIGSGPMKNHRAIKQTEFRKQRRALTVDEIQKLLSATEAASKRFNMTGHQRALVYKLALETGMRFGEIASLNVASFSFHSSPPTVRVEAANAKGKKTSDLILMSQTATMIERQLCGKDPQEKAFPMPHKANGAAMMRKDLDAAKIKYTDESGRDCDFHALRHTFITNLSRAGVHPTVAQKLARHSSIELTMKYYTHVLYESEVSAIASLQNITATATNERKNLSYA